MQTWVPPFSFGDISSSFPPLCHCVPFLLPRITVPSLCLPSPSSHSLLQHTNTHSHSAGLAVSPLQCTKRTKNRTEKNVRANMQEALTVRVKKILNQRLNDTGSVSLKFVNPLLLLLVWPGSSLFLASLSLTGGPFCPLSLSSASILLPTHLIILNDCNLLVYLSSFIQTYNYLHIYLLQDYVYPSSLRKTRTVHTK